MKLLVTYQRYLYILLWTYLTKEMFMYLVNYVYSSLRGLDDRHKSCETMDTFIAKKQLISTQMNLNGKRKKTKLLNYILKDIIIH